MDNLRRRWGKAAEMGRFLLGYLFAGALLELGRVLHGLGRVLHGLGRVLHGLGRAFHVLGSRDVLFSGLGRWGESFDGRWVSICTLKGHHLAVH
jgi:hypothetical protein